MRAIAALFLVAPLACKTAVRPTGTTQNENQNLPPDAGVPDAGPPPLELPAQPGAIIATVGDIAVLALDAPAFAQLPPEKRRLAWQAAQAAAALDAVSWDRGHALEVARLLRAILSRPAVVPPLLLPRIREFARAVYLNRGIHDAETRRKLVPPFSMAELRFAALAAQAAGADFALRGAKLEYALRALEGPLFDPRVGPLPPPANLRNREPPPALPDPVPPVDFFLASGRLFIGIADEERSGPLLALAKLGDKIQAAEKRPAPLAEALQLAGGVGPLPDLGFSLPRKSFLFAAAGDAVDKVRSNGAVAALADPALAPELLRCLSQHRFASLALRELAGRRFESLDTTLEEARADLVAHVLAADPQLREMGLITARCQELWPQFAATSWFASQAHLPSGDRIEDERQRAIQLQLWWFTGKGALSERHQGGRRFLSADPARFQKSAAELLGLLQDIAASHDMARLRDLLETHASKLDTQWRDEVIERLRAAGVPRRVAVLPPQIVPVLAEGKVIDAQVKPVDDFDAQIVKDWSSL